jgi:hypothetical protein
MASLGKALITIGIVIVVLGLLIWGGSSLSSLPIVGRLGRLPGDIYVQRGNFSFYFPITTAIVLSVAISLVLALLRR